MNIEETLAIVDNLVQPQRLSTLQEMIFRECWEGKTYQQIAENSDYDADYIRVVGSRLWQSLTEACEEKVTKNNFRSILRQQSRQNITNNIPLELPDGPIAAVSNFYIERPPIEEICRLEIAKPGALVRIKAAKNMGKKSLLRRILADEESKYNTVKLSLQQVDSKIINNFSQLIRWFCANLCSALEIENIIDEYWDKDLGIKVSCTSYLQDHILDQLDKPLVLALDKLHLIFEHTETAQEFLSLLRFWHEEANNLLIWQKLRLIVIQSTESYVPLNFNQSPFNVGLPVTLPEFNREQMMDLAQRHQLDWRKSADSDNLTTLMNLIGGHPYLARLAFYNLAKYNLTLQELVANAPTETSIYRDILRYYLAIFYNKPMLAQAFKKVISSYEPIQLESITAYQLESLGLIKLKGNEAIASFQLYRLYFKDRLNNL
ncbi:conserved hypothetical protein [Hyella patelloides LEGE 07179]|uniref:vWA-MoxR associated protein N-terminal HTH domain-containing protein n=1 Tax=Hyella patelloides LEGE 07179 TaxID=945734 RepID=A0A563W0U8_9CYAN|nr:AAA-like domain-containing protein [Hyella patelloides]VEP17332.1 conserved hypothetical protein [Hyella patelloides LEGE 07179]